MSTITIKNNTTNTEYDVVTSDIQLKLGGESVTLPATSRTTIIKSDATAGVVTINHYAGWTFATGVSSYSLSVQNEALTFEQDVVNLIHREI